MNFRLLLLPFCFIACLDAEPPADAPKPFFDLAGYMDAEVDRWEALNEPVTKTALVNGDEATRTVSDLNFEESLAPFRRADINRPAWLDQYAVDSTENVVTYRALSDDLRTRFLTVERTDGEVIRIKIENQTDSPVTKTRQFLTYEPLQRFEIRATQRVVTLDSTTLRILVER